MSAKKRATAEAQPPALRFFATSGDDPFVRPTVCWIRREPGINLTDWTLHLEDPGGEAEPVVGLKEWALFGAQDYRYLDPAGGAGAHRLRSYGREEVLTKYLAAVVATIPPASRESVWCLAPAIADAARRKAYYSALRAAVPQARILHEPEMVLEYFRLVRREVTLETGRHGIYLIVDSGASTTNFTIVISNLDETVTGAETARARPKSLDAKVGNALGLAGSWIDRQLADQLGWKSLLRSMAPVARDRVLAALEAAKVRAGISGATVDIEGADAPTVAAISVDQLRATAETLWAHLRPLFLDVARKFLAEIGQGKHGAPILQRLSEAGIDGPEGIHRVIDGVFLAGGTSQLPGFQAAMLAMIFPANPGVPIYAVGPEYRLAAAVGALAHVLDQTYRPSRLVAKEGLDTADSLVAVPLQTTVTADVLWGTKRNDEPERRVVVLEAGDPLFSTGGERALVDVPHFENDETFRTRLLPNDLATREGFSLTEVTAIATPVEVAVAYDEKVREVRLRSAQLRGASAVLLNLNLVREAAKKPKAPPTGAAYRLWSAGAPDVVVDLGMSKTVVVTAGEGRFDVPTVPAASERTAPLVPIEAPPDVDVPTAQSKTTPPPDSPPQPAETTEVLLPTEEPWPSPPTATTPTPPPRETTPLDEYGPALLEALRPLISAGQGATAANLAMLALALAVRPFVLIAGPPGSGKSSLVRTLARLLRLSEQAPHQTFFDVAVQPHWRTERSVPQAVRATWETPREGATLLLFDEINLARPENYLMPLFRRLDAQGPSPGPLLVCGTLNIDDASRPPSPKVIDRAFLMEVDAPWTNAPYLAPSEFAQLTLGTLPHLPSLVEPASTLHGDVNAVLDVIGTTARTGKLRQDLLPSHRDRADLSAILALHRATAMPEALLPESEVVDRAVSGRLLVKLSGSAEQVEDLVAGLWSHFESRRNYPRCRRRLLLARDQLKLGFVSPWQ